MLDRKTLRDIAETEMIRIYGVPYLRETFHSSITATAIRPDGRFFYFLGIKTSKDLPERKADEKGWVVSAQLHLDANTGELLDIRYTKE